MVRGFWHIDAESPVATGPCRAIVAELGQARGVVVARPDRETGMHLDAGAALAFLPFVAAIALWVAWSDMARMKIPNAAVLALMGVYAAVGPVVLPLGAWGWGFAAAAGVLVLGFLGNAAGLFGAGDAKFAAAAAPFVAAGDIALLGVVLALVTLGAVAAHRLARRVRALRAAVPHWESWEAEKFPAGLALGPTLAIYLGLCAAG